MKMIAKAEQLHRNTVHGDANDGGMKCALPVSDTVKMSK